MTKLFEKVNKWVIVAIAGLVAVARLVSGIVALSDNAKTGAASFVGALVYLALMGLIILYTIKEKKELVSIFVLVLLGGFALNALSSAVSMWTSLSTLPEGLADGAAKAYSIMGGFASLCAFVAGCSYLAIKLTGKYVDILKLIVSIALIGAIVFYIAEVVCYGVSDFYLNKTANIFSFITSILLDALLLVLVNKE